MTWPFSDRLPTNSALSGIPAVNLSSFADYLRRQAPELLPAILTGGGQAGAAGAQLPHGTTIVALKYPGGVLIAGDRRSTQGNMIAGRDVQQGVHHRRLHRHRHRRHRRDRRRVRPALRGRTRALRKARRRAAHLRRQGQPARDHGARQPGRRDAGAGGAAAAGGLRHPRGRPGKRRAHRLVRRRRRLEHRGRGLPVGGVRIDLRQVVDQEAVLAGHRRRFGAAGRCRGAVRRRRRRLGYRRAGSGSRHLPDGGHHRRRGRGRRAESRIAELARRSSKAVRAQTLSAPTAEPRGEK